MFSASERECSPNKLVHTQLYKPNSGNLGQHSATDPSKGGVSIAMKHQSQGQERRDLNK